MTDKQPKPVSEIIARLFDIRTERSALSKRDSELVVEFDELEAQLLGRLDEDGLDRASTKIGTASIGTTILPQIDDWDAFLAHLKETGNLHLLQRRVAAAAFREILESGGTVPGVSPFPHREINLRASQKATT